MSITNYAELTAAVASWLARDDLAPQVPSFIAMAEAKLNRSLRYREMEKRSSTAVDLSSLEPQYVALPTDYHSIRSVCLSGVVEKPRLQYLNDVQIEDYRSNIGDLTAMPRFFGVIGSEIVLVPKPDLAYALEMVYRARIPALAAGNPTNWLLSLAPDIYLYGTLLEASVYMENDARIPVWLSAFSSAVDGLNKLDDSAQAT